MRLNDAKLKKIIEVLSNANSSYLGQFKDLQGKITEGCDEAEDNLKFLKLLYDPCLRLDQAQPKDIPKIIPEVLNCVRMIWELSKYYNTPDRMKTLLIKISNQIIQRCRAKINKEDMFGDQVEKCM